MTSANIHIRSFLFGPFQTNCYVLSSPACEHKEAAILIVDPACATPAEQRELSTYVADLQSSMPSASVSIIATHGHLDHLWGAAWACDQWHASVRMHSADIPMARAMQSQYNMFGIRAVPRPFPIVALEAESSAVSHSALEPFQCIHTPGHTPGSVCLYWPDQRLLMSGDTLFCMGYGRTDLPGGNMQDLISSLHRLFTLPADVIVYPGHGEITTIGEEKR